MGVEGVWVDVNLVLLNVATNGGHFCNAFDARERVAHIPVLGCPQLM